MASSHCNYDIKRQDTTSDDMTVMSHESQMKMSEGSSQLSHQLDDEPRAFNLVTA